MGCQKSVKIQVVGLSDTGVVREHNEDDFLILPNIGFGGGGEDITTKVEYIVPAHGSLFIVADAMGGANAGELTANLVIQSIKESFHKGLVQLTSSNSEEDYHIFFNNVVKDCNSCLRVTLKKNKELVGIGATVVFAWVFKSKIYIGWLGNSRAYLYRDSKLTLITKDHTLENEMLANGLLNNENQLVDNQDHIITQLLGVQEHELKIGFVVSEMNVNDKYLFVTDGVHGMMTDSQIELCVEKELIVGDGVRKLIKKANDLGGYDNITALTCSVLEENVVLDTIEALPKKNTLIKKVIVFTVVVLAVILLLLTWVGYNF